MLFVAIDDLSDWIPPLDQGSPIAMPNLSRLAQRGTLFRRAYCAAPQCNPSRTALLSGLRPTTTGVYANEDDWKQAMPKVVMLPRYFRNNGYTTIGAGKIYHHFNPRFHDDASFDEYLPFVMDRVPPKKFNGLTRARTPDGQWEQVAPTFDWGPSPTAESEMLDTRSADFAVEFLRRTQDKPFFLAVGFFRPHLPYFVPPRFLDRYPPAKMSLPVVKADDLDDVPAGAQPFLENWKRMFRAIQQAPDATAKWREAVAGYAAGATYADEQLGRIVDALDHSHYRDNTIIIVWSDNGYLLGEKNHWSKFVLWEKATHVPLIVIAPGVTKPGTACDRPVSLMDLYPTLVELCHLPDRPDLDGISLVPLLEDPTVPRDGPVLMTAMRGNHALRTERWRYIHYADGGEELYDHDVDPNEWTNLAREPRFNDVLAQHRRWLPQKEAARAPDFRTAPGVVRGGPSTKSKSSIKDTKPE
ncbi:MAG: sulfatase [Opitutaceae bacterium]|nr:sulfatase [Opitutaceae bacterium]